MELQLLRDQNTAPTEEVLKGALGDIYPVFEQMMNAISGAEYGITCDWNYYKDGKSWLCKASFKKKTVFWLSVWEGYFQVGLFFTEKHLEGIAELDIDEQVKEDFCRTKPIGKLLPMVFKISHIEQLNDLLKAVEFKRSLK